MKFRDIEGAVVEAVQFADPANPPQGIFSKEVLEDGRKVTKAFIATKDKDGDANIDGAFSSIAVGIWIVTHADGRVSLCHPNVFPAQFTAVNEG